jgi:hypothetical protein
MKTVRLTETDLNRIVKRVISEGTRIYSIYDDVNEPLNGTFTVNYNPQTKEIKLKDQYGQYWGTIAPNPKSN